MASGGSGPYGPGQRRVRLPWPSPLGWRGPGLGPDIALPGGRHGSASLIRKPTVPDGTIFLGLRRRKGKNRSRSFWLGCSAPVVEADGPEVGRNSDADAPGDGGGGGVADGRAGEQSAHGVGDWGEGLVLG